MDGPRRAPEAVEGILVLALTQEQYAFLDECQKGEASLKKITGYLKKGVPINLKDDRVHSTVPKVTGRTCLHYAIENMDVALMMMLLQKGADPNVQDSDGATPLHVVVATGGVTSGDDWANETAAELLKYKADPNRCDVENKPPLSDAAGANFPSLCQLLLQYAADPNIAINSSSRKGWTPVDRAIQTDITSGTDTSSVVMVLLRYGASKFGKTRESVLCFLASRSRRDGIDFLLGNRTKYNVTSVVMNDALSCASSPDMVHALLDKNAEASSRTVETIAAAGYWSAVGALLSRGAPMTPRVRRAAEKETGLQPSFIAQSIVDKAEANYTPAHWAARFCDAYAVSLHIATESDTDILAKDDSTPFSIARAQQERCPGIDAMLTSFKAAKDNLAFAEANATEAKKNAKEAEDNFKRAELERRFAEANATEAKHQSTIANQKALEAEYNYKRADLERTFAESNATELRKKNALEAEQKEQAHAQDKANRKARNAIVGAVAEGVCFASQLLNIFLINIDTIWKCNIVVQLSLPSIAAAAAAVMYAAGWQALAFVHSLAVILELIAIAMTACRGERVRHWLHCLKQRGETRQERVWLRVDCMLHCFLGIFMLLGEIWTKAPEPLVILAGVVNAIVATLSMTNVLPPRKIAVILGATGLAALGLMVNSGVKGELKLAVDGDREDASPALIVLTNTWLLIAFIHVPRTLTNTADSIFDATSGLELTVMPSMLRSRVPSMLTSRVPSMLTARGRFQASAFTMAEGAVAAIGLEAALGLSKEEISKGEKLGIDAIRAEVEATKDVNDMENWVLEGSQVGFVFLHEVALKLVCGRDILCKVMCGAVPGDPGGSQGSMLAGNPRQTDPKISSQAAFRYPGKS
jgi:hypothetical protein